MKEIQKKALNIIEGKEEEIEKIYNNKLNSRKLSIPIHKKNGIRIKFRNLTIQANKMTSISESKFCEEKIVKIKISDVNRVHQFQE